VVLSNSILFSISVFYFSFLKTIVSIQRKFLWGGVSGDKEKIPWVSRKYHGGKIW
jgi:hypothetical protein